MKKLTLILLFISTNLFAQDFIEHFVDNSFDDALHAISIDLDGDGDKDLVGAAYTADEIAWYENDGTQNYTKHIIDNSVDGAIYITAKDIDSDNDIDIVVNTFNGNEVLLFLNDGTQNFNKNTIDSSANGSNYNTVNDFDGNGILDIISANLNDDELVIYKVVIIFGIPLPSQTVIDSLNGANSVESADIDGDSDLDLLVTALNGDEIVWYENDGNANFTKHSIDTSALGALTAYPVDFDADGDIDFVASISGRLLPTGGDEVAWYENDGSQNFTKHSVDAACDYAAFGHSVDLDNDGDLDIVASATNSNELRWYESDGATPPAFTTHVILGGPIGDSYSIDIDDMDGDGWQDIIVAAPGNNSIRIFENMIGSTLIPDANFENYLETHDANGTAVSLGDPSSMGNGIANDHKVYTANIENVTNLNVSSQNIADLTGIEDFTALIVLNCSANQLTTLDFSSNLDLKQLYCNSNTLTSLDVSLNTFLQRLNCSNNNLNAVDIINNTQLITFYAGQNQLLEIDASYNTALTQFNAQNNPGLNSLNIKNGNNSNIADGFFRIQNTPNLFCIEVDNEAYSTTNWTTYINTNHYFKNKCETIWTGTPTAAWSDGAPTDGAKAVIIEEPYTTSTGNIYGKSLLVRAGTGTGNGSLTINAGSYAKIKKDLVNETTITIEKEGSFIQIDDNATVSGAGTFNVKVAINPIPSNTTNPSQSARYTYFASPTQGETLNVFSAWAEMGSIYSFSGAIQYWVSEASGNTMNKGIGYIVRTKNSDTYPIDGTTASTGLTTFTGAFNNGVSTHTLTYNAGGTDDDSILVGNPYPSAISTAKIFTDNPSVTALHFWRHAQGADLTGNFNESYAVKTFSGTTFGAPTTISTGQGFFAEASAAGDLTFKNDLRLTGDNNTFLRPQNLDKAWFNLTTSTGVEAQIQVGFIPNCTDGFDNQHDAHNIDSGSYLSLYTNGVGNDAQDLVIQARAPLNNTDSVIPLGFNMNNSTINQLTLSLDHLESFTGYDIYLRDIDNSVLHNIKDNPYNFTVSQTGNFNTRFELVFSRNALSVNDNVLTSDDLIIANQDINNFKVKMANGATITNFKAFDVVGKLIIDMDTNSSNFTVNNNLKQGTVLFVKATLENGQVLSKKFIKL